MNMEATRLAENIELYAKGKLDVNLVSHLEDIINNDPKVANEVALQKTIISTIKQDRKALLKARLDNIQIPAAGNMGNTSSLFTALKAASVVLVSVGIGWGIYAYYNNLPIEEVPLAEVNSNIKIQQLPNVTSKNTVKLPEEEKLAYTSNVIKEKESKGASEIIANTESTESTQEEIEVSHASKKISTSNWNPFKKTSKTEAKKVPDMEAFDDDSEADVNSDIKVPKQINTQASIHKTSDVDIKTIQDGSHSFHYRLKENVLFLYGKFEASPYEILEFNDKTGQILYLYYDQSYFGMTPHKDEITKLKKITDKKLIDDLEVARSR